MELNFELLLMVLSSIAALFATITTNRSKEQLRKMEVDLQKEKDEQAKVAEAEDALREHSLPLGSAACELQRRIYRSCIQPHVRKLRESEEEFEFSGHPCMSAGSLPDHRPTNESEKYPGISLRASGEALSERASEKESTKSDSASKTDAAQKEQEKSEEKQEEKEESSSKPPEAKPEKVVNTGAKPRLPSKEEMEQLILHILYTFGCYLGWVYLYRSRALLAKMSDIKETAREFHELLDCLEKSWTTQSVESAPGSTDLFRLSKAELLAIGELMCLPQNELDPTRQRPICFVAFTDRMTTPLYQKWFASLRKSCMAFAAAPNVTVMRLYVIQNNLLDLVDFIDPDCSFFPIRTRERLEIPRGMKELYNGD